MKMFLTASIYGRKKYEANYQKIVSLIQKMGHQVMADHILNEENEDHTEWKKQQQADFHHWAASEIQKADIVLAEVSYNSTSVGYMVALAVNAGKPVIIFHCGTEEPHLFKALEKDNERVVIVRYKSIEELDQKVPEIIEYMSDLQDVRFNFFISPKHSNYLNWISKTKKIPRSVFLRRLIDEEMKKTLA